MHGRKRLVVSFIGLLFFIAFVLGIVQPLPSRAAFAGDGLGMAVATIVIILAIIVASLSGAVASTRQMMHEPNTRTPGAIAGTVFSTLIGIGFVALVAAAIVR